MEFVENKNRAGEKLKKCIRFSIEFGLDRDINLHALTPAFISDELSQESEPIQWNKYTS